MTTQTETATLTGPEAYAKAVEHAQEAARLISNDIYNVQHDRAAAHALISQAFTAIAAAATPQPAPAPASVEPELKRRLWLPARRTKTD
ncbi:hypothetical protein [Streptomyces sp. NPDC048669]|uniref:hypothetical protein n=1 Tax=Streptomyces sp. NPDC048669 TaxID=3155267 RepID=UPI003439E30A